MSRISIEVIIAAVKRCVSGESSYTEEMKLLGVPKQTLQDWIRKYETFGIEGFLPSGNEKYSKGTKERAVNAYLNGEGSQAYICRKFKIKDRKTLRTWIKVYNSHRELRPSRGRGSDIYMTKGRNTTYEERVEIVSYCIEHGNDYVATIEKYGVSYQQIYSWVRKYNEKGAEGLVDKRGKRKPESEMTELEKLRAENRMLEARNKRLELECAVLKKLEEIEGRWR
jgi:transposase-like protein